MGGPTPEAATARPQEDIWAGADLNIQSAARHVRQVCRTLDAVLSDLNTLREHADELARLDVAQRLLEGEDGKALALLVTLAGASCMGGIVRHLPQARRLGA